MYLIICFAFRFLILEHVSGGELFDYLVKRGRLPLGEVTAVKNSVTKQACKKNTTVNN